MKRALMTFVLSASLAALATAGALRGFRCTDEKCGFQAEVLTGEGKLAIQVAGYCVECGKMRTVSFLRDDLKTKRPEPAARARLVLPDGPEIQLNEKSRVIGRAELARALDLDTLGLISRKHFEITYAEDSFFIEDKASPNGTSLNGKAIAGQGPVKLNDADLIEPAGAIKLKFIIL
jgi:hypothetical protein